MTDRVIAQVRPDAKGYELLEYEDLLAAVQKIIVDLNVPIEPLEEHMGLTRGHLGKILGLTQVRRIGLETLWKIVAGIGYRLAIIRHLDIEAARDEMSEKYHARRARRHEKRIVRKRITPALAVAAAPVLGAMGKGIPKCFRSKRAMVAQRRSAGRASGRARRKKAMANRAPVNPRPDPATRAPSSTPAAGRPSL